MTIFEIIYVHLYLLLFLIDAYYYVAIFNFIIILIGFSNLKNYKYRLFSKCRVFNYYFYLFIYFLWHNLL